MGVFWEQVVLSQFHESLDKFLEDFFFCSFDLVLFCFDMLKVTGSVSNTAAAQSLCLIGLGGLSRVKAVDVLLSL